MGIGSLLMPRDMRFIVEHDHIGWLDDEKMWLFGNVAVKDDGSELRPDEMGYFGLRNAVSGR